MSGLFNIAGKIAGLLSTLASSVGASLIGFLPAGAGAAATTVQAKLREAVNVDTKAELKALPPPLITTFATVKGGEVYGDGFGAEYFWDNTANNPDNGDTVLITTAGGTGRWKKIRQDDKSGWTFDPRCSLNAHFPNQYSNKRWPKEIVFIGDSITYGWPNGNVAHSQSILGYLQIALGQLTGHEQGIWPNGGIWHRYTMAGSVSYGANGPTGVSLILGVGATATITGDYLDIINYNFQRSVGAGILEIRVNGNLVSTGATSGPAANDVQAVIDLDLRYGKNVTVEFKAIGSSVELTAIKLLRFPAGGVPIITSHAYPGFSTNQYAIAQRLDSIQRCINYTIQPALYVIALGCNDAYNSDPAYRATSAQYETNLQIIVSYLKTLSVQCVLCVPLRPTAPAALWDGTETFENYRNAVYRVAKANKSPVIDQSIVDFSLLYADGVHPTAAGYGVLGAYFFNQLGLDSVITDNVISKCDLTLAGTAIIFGAPYSNPTFSVERDGITRLHGVVNVTGMAKNAHIFTISDTTANGSVKSGRPLAQKNIIANAWGGGALCTVLLVINQNGIVQMLDYTGSPEQLSLDGITFSTLY